MNYVKVRRVELLEKIKTNRAKHVKEYEAACAGYKEVALNRIDEVFEELRERISSLKEGKVIDLMAVQFGLDAPQSYEKSYNQAIAMLEMCVEEELQISNQEFAQYVMDDWSWKEQFTTTSSTYALENLRKLKRK